MTTNSGERSSFRPTRVAALCALCVGALLSLAGCDSTERRAPGEGDSGTAEPDGSTRDAGFPDGGIGENELALTRLAPSNGPFLGGNEVLVRGGGFTEGMAIEIGDRLVDAPDLDVVGPNRALIFAMPAGEPGPADVVVTRPDGATLRLEGGYTYNSLALDPVRGSVSGGTRVTITGMATDFREGDEILFGRRPCTDVEVVSTSTYRCKTPAAARGFQDVTYVPSATRDTPLEDIVLEEAFEFYDTSDPTFGGLAGGALDGTLNVSVIDIVSGLAISDAFVFVGDEAPEHAEHQGLTNILGQITFSGDDLFGQQVVHAAKRCYETTSWVAFDAQNVSIFLTPWFDPDCAPPGEGGGPGGGRAGAFVSGELLWTVEFEPVRPNPWDNLPEPPDADWTRVAYVYATQPCPGTAAGCTNPDPAAGGSIQRVLESAPGTRGYPYRIFVRPAAFAVYSIAGLENRSTGEFVPHIMGIARNVLAGPGQEVEGADMIMNIPLDGELDVQLEQLPAATALGPSRFEVSADVDLGGEGVIVRRVRGQSLDVARADGADDAFHFSALPAIQGALSDARYRVEAAWRTGSVSSPTTVARVGGIRNLDDVVTVRGFPPIPAPTAPGFGEAIPEDRVLRWQSEGGTEPDFYYIGLVDSNRNPVWRYFVRGDQTSAPIPNLADIPGTDIEDIEEGLVSWFIYAVRIPGFDYDEMTYVDLRMSSWNAWSFDTHTARQ